MGPCWVARTEIQSPAGSHVSMLRHMNDAKVGDEKRGRDQRYKSSGSESPGIVCQSVTSGSRDAIVSRAKLNVIPSTLFIAYLRVIHVTEHGHM